MPSGHSEVTAYVNEGDAARVADALTALCIHEGMRAVATPRGSGVRYVLSPSDRWTFALFPGAPGWTVVHAQPWNTLCRASATGPSRFVDLCTALGVRGFMIDVVDVVPHGSMLVETDGLGLHRLSGWYFDATEYKHEYHGTPLDLDSFERTTFDVCADLASAVLFAERRSAFDNRNCLAIARDVGGANGALLWCSGEDFSGAWADVQEAMLAGEPPPVADAVLLQFESATPGLDL